MFNNVYLPIVMRSLRGYDIHLVIKQAFAINNHIGNRIIHGKPISDNMFVAFSIGDIKLIDNFQFLTSSLNSLVENL